MTPAARLGARLEVTRAGFALRAGFEVPEGETLALVGPSGAGKSTALRLIAGVDALDGGRIVFGAEVLDDPDDGVFVPPSLRGVGWVPQGGALLPHLTAIGNVAFALRRRGGRRADARRGAGAWLERVGLDSAAWQARPVNLSGGETRRVALARALSTRPRILLLDEPLEGLDAGARDGLRRVLREVLGESGGAQVIVAHDPLDALALASRVVVLEGGAVVQQGTPVELCERPRSAYVGELAGWNVVAGVAGVEDGHPVVRHSGGSLQVAEAGSGSVVAVFRPSAVGVYRTAPEGSPRNVLRSSVVEVAPSGERVRVRLDAPFPVVAELTADSARSLAVRPGEEVFAVVKATEIRVWQV